MSSGSYRQNCSLTIKAKYSDMKKAAIAIALFLGVIVLSVGQNGQTLPYSTTNLVMKSFGQVYLETIELNRHRFTDINKIDIGDSVLVAAKYYGGPNQFFIAHAPWFNNGKHDCIWVLVQKYIADELPTEPVYVPEEPKKEPTEPAAEKPVVVTEKTAIPWWAWLILGLLAGALLIIFIRDQIRQRENTRNNPDAFPPVISGGLSNNDQEAINQIASQRNLTPSNVAGIRRGVIVRDSGPTEVLTMMEFGDRNNRPTYIRPGERVTEVTFLINGQRSIQYWRDHCGNAFTVIAHGQFIMPTGWRFEENATPVTAASENAAPAVIPAPTAAVAEFAPMAPIVDNQFIPTIVRAVPKNTESIDMKVTTEGINVFIKMHNPEEVKK